MNDATKIPDQPFEDWINDVSPLIAAQARLINMYRDNHDAAKQGDRPRWSDEEMEQVMKTINGMKGE